jgi:hypothetical protein
MISDWPRRLGVITGTTCVNLDTEISVSISFRPLVALLLERIWRPQELLNIATDPERFTPKTD